MQLSLFQILVIGFWVLCPYTASAKIGARTIAPEPGHKLVETLEQVWQAHLELPEAKQEALKPLFADAASRIAPQESSVWARRVGSLGVSQDWQNPYHQEAQQAYAELGEAEFYTRALAASPPFTIARLDLLLALGEIQPDQIPKITRTLSNISRQDSGDDFTRTLYASGAMYMAALGCDQTGFAEASGLKKTPLGSEEMLWQRRLIADMAFDLSTLGPGNTEDTGPFRGALRGLVFLHNHGYCD